MEKPKIIQIMGSIIESRVEESRKKGIELDYYSAFIEFLEKEKNDMLLNGGSMFFDESLRKQTGLNIGIEQLEYGIKYLKFEQQQTTGKIFIEQGTARQTTLAFIYMQKAMKFPRKSGTNKTDADFLRFLTGHSSETIRKLLGNPLKRSNEKSGKGTQELISDLTIVLNHFERIQFNDGVKLVEDEIKTLQNDLKTFNEV